MGQLFADAARAYLSAGIAAGDTTISISSGGNLFPVATGTDWFKAVLQDASGIEIVYVTAHTSGATSFTVTRGQEGTTARSFAAGAVFGIRVTSADMAGFAGKLSDAPSDGKTYGRKDAAWAEAGDVTTNGAQTLLSKTIHGNANTLTVDGTNEVGFRHIPQNSQIAAYTLVLADAGKHILHPAADTTARTFTIPANSVVAFPIGTVVTFINQNGGLVTIAITTDTMRLAGAGTTGSRTLARNGVATAIKITATEWIISGTGLT